MKLSIVSRYIGVALLFNAFFMFLGVLVSIIYDFDTSFSPLFLSGSITLLAGLFPLLFVKKSSDISIKEGFTIVIFSWLLSCLFGMLPYVLWGGEFSLVNAWYESVSGYTTTGSTILTNIEALPKGLLFWRSSTHFIGGMGVVIFMLLVLPSVSTFRMRLSKMEISALSKENYKFKTKQTIYIIASVYLGIATMAFISLMLAGMDWFDAINHAFSIAATGGFSTRNESILAFDSLWIEMVITLFMFLASVHFGLLYTSVVNRSLKFFKSPVIRFYLCSLLITGVIIAFDIKISGNVDNIFTAFRQSIFQVVSMASTTGFATADTAVWPNLSILILMYLSIQCACSGSTTGGLKIDRLLIFINSFKAQLKKTVHPNAVVPVRVGNHAIEPELVSTVNIFIILYVAMILVGAIVFSVFGVSFIDAFSASISHMGNVGPAFGSVGSLDNYSHFPTMAKFLSTLQMLLGRLEIYTLLVIFVIYKWR